MTDPHGPAEAKRLHEEAARINEQSRILANELAWFVTHIPHDEPLGRVAAEVDVAARMLVDHYTTHTTVGTNRRSDPPEEMILIDRDALYALNYVTAVPAAQEAVRQAKERHQTLASELTWFVYHLPAFKIPERVAAEIAIAEAILRGAAAPRRPDGENYAANQTLIPRNTLIALVDTVANGPSDTIAEAALVDARKALER